LKLKCHCNPKDNFDWKGMLYILRLYTNFTRYLEANKPLGYSCLSRHFEINGLEKPEGYEAQMD